MHSGGPTFTAAGSAVLMQDGPWEVRVDQQSADELLAIFERLNAVSAHNNLYDACQRAGFLPTVSPIPRGPRLVADNGPNSHTRRMLEASVAVIAPTPGPEAA